MRPKSGHYHGEMQKEYFGERTVRARRGACSKTTLSLFSEIFVQNTFCCKQLSRCGTSSSHKPVSAVWRQRPGMSIRGDLLRFNEVEEQQDTRIRLYWDVFWSLKNKAYIHTGMIQLPKTHNQYRAPFLFTLDMSRIAPQNYRFAESEYTQATRCCLVLSLSPVKYKVDWSYSVWKKEKWRGPSWIFLLELRADVVIETIFLLDQEQGLCSLLYIQSPTLSFTICVVVQKSLKYFVNWFPQWK